MAKGLKNSIENMYKRMIMYSLITAILTVVVGIVLLLVPELRDMLIRLSTPVKYRKDV